jgi:protein-ribulosamine 3-kinase
MLPTPLFKHLCALLDQWAPGETGKPVFRSVSGGSINEAGVISKGSTTAFVKWNDATRYPGMFESEARGLRLLADPGNAVVPRVLKQGTEGGTSFLVLEYIQPCNADAESADHFGEMLARLHRNTAPCFGLDHDNYMGSLIQRNTFHDSWNSFFINERLIPQIKPARDKEELSKGDSLAFERLFVHLPEIIPEEPPALVHGDLWSGNYLTSKNKQTWLIDPAAAYGHREVDIAMSKLFGGFHPRFYQIYQQHFPLQHGWEQRIPLFQLYPLLVHVNLFGGGYAGSVKEILKRF